MSNKITFLLIRLTKTAMKTDLYSLIIYNNPNREI